MDSLLAVLEMFSTHQLVSSLYRKGESQNLWIVDSKLQENPREGFCCPSYRSNSPPAAAGNSLSPEVW